MDDENQNDLPDLLTPESSFSFTITNNPQFMYNNEEFNTEIFNDYSFLDDFMNRILNSNFENTVENTVEYTRHDDNYTQYFSGALNEIVSDYMNDYYNNNNIDYILSIYNRDTNNTIENILNQSFEEAPTLCKKENQNINLQQFIYTKGDNSTESCTICLCDFENGTSISTLDCSHVFHYSCLKEWCQYKSQCPICRDEIKIN